MKRLTTVLIGLLSVVAAGFSQNIMVGEYFFDYDPGIGNATPFSVSVPGVNINETFTLTAGAQTQGPHMLYIRLQDANGNWSVPSGRAFYATDTSISTINYAEYSIDTIVPPGMGTPIPVNAIADTATIDEIFAHNQLIGMHRIYVRVRTANGLWSLPEGRDFEVCAVAGPLANFGWVQSFKYLSFLDSSIGADSYLWDFGDGTTDTFASPNHLFDTTGNFTVRLITTNPCGVDTMEQLVTISGIEEINTNKGGQGGIVSPTITGYGFKTGTTVCFRKTNDTSVIFLPDTIGIFNDQAMVTVLNLVGVDTGYYNVEVKIPGDTMHVLVAGFEVQTLIEPTMTIELLGGGDYRFGRFAKIPLVIKNNGNVDAYLVPVIISGIPDSLILTPNANMFAAGNYPLFDSTMQDMAAAGVDTNGLKNPNQKEPVQRVQTQSLIIRQVPAGSSVTITPAVRVNDQRELDITATVRPPLVNNNSDDCFGTALKCAVSVVLEQAFNLSGWKNCTKSLIGLIEQVVGDVTGVSNIANAQTLALGGNAKAGVVSDALSDQLLSYPLLLGKVAWDCGGTIVKQLPVGKLATVVQTALKLLSGAADLKSKAGTFACIYDTYQACGENNSNSRKTKRYSFINSSDPNKKVGPGSVGDGYIRGDDGPLCYAIYFENVDTAPVAAQIVTVRDTLDASRFDFNTFMFIGYGFADNYLSSPNNKNNFTDLLDLRPTHPNLLRVTGDFDNTTGIVTWVFTTLDTLNLQPTEAVFEGFLPPNITSPEGEGFVAFAVHLLPGLQEGTIIENSASIVFDANAAIITNLWDNTTDTTAPVSTIDALPGILNDTVFTVSWGGTDNIAGIRYFDIWVSQDGDPYEQLMVQTTAQSTSFTGQFGSNYKFYSVATDSAGNEEQKVPYDEQVDLEETVIGIGNLMDTDSWLGQNYPNPVSGYTTIKFYLHTADQVALTLTDIAGKESTVILSGPYKAGLHSITLDKSQMAGSGVYTYQLTGATIQANRKLVILE